jgi:hypothetical protein
LYVSCYLLNILLVEHLRVGPIGVSSRVKTEEMEKEYNFIRTKLGVEGSICSRVPEKRAQLVEHPYV